MTTTALVSVSVTINDGTKNTVVEQVIATISDVVGDSGKRETVSLSAAFNALSPPTGATGVFLKWVSGTGTWHLKNVTGDATGIALGTPSATTPAIFLPLSSAGLGILASGSGSLEAIWV